MSIDFQNLFICFQCGLRLSGLTFVFVTEEKLTNPKRVIMYLSGWLTMIDSSFPYVRWAGTWSGLAFSDSLYQCPASSRFFSLIYASPVGQSQKDIQNYLEFPGLHADKSNAKKSICHWISLRSYRRTFQICLELTLNLWSTMFELYRAKCSKLPDVPRTTVHHGMRLIKTVSNKGQKP